MAESNKQTKQLTILERVQRSDVVSRDTFMPKFSSGLVNSSEKLSNAIKKTTNTYRKDGTKFGGKPFPWD
ncbi:hypothetical protein DSCO28_57600 [Desulfosarcina ovata subsp. sediminis]|uniref:Uncharacterized protein n=1 Tax=Desulfosarcina ovata subsp. sediminis TaxID=885957 RepID=A0A5K7ZYH5_9BACT|nr:hypothetical protein [Desulfosarcina ovata]BBO85194.1 hypothetical protein DSCO28_57600 [Desulfosarcina ovata subsp. sediminis]